MTARSASLLENKIQGMMKMAEKRAKLAKYLLALLGIAAVLPILIGADI
jgi:hypothetical protein